MTRLELELLQIERNAVAAEWQRIAEAVRLLALVDEGLAAMRSVIAGMEVRA
jgi:hypothetical protein